MKFSGKYKFATIALGGLILCLTAVNTGCQVSVGGQTLPSSYYHHDDIQYFPKGPEFKLQKQAAALKAARAEQETRR